MPVALGKGSFALGKAFAECNTRQRASVESPSGKGCFAECQISGTRQRLCRVPEEHSAKIYTRQNENAKKKPKIIANFFFGGGHHRPASARLHRSRCIFCANFAANAAGGIRTHDPSLAYLLLYHCTTLSLVSRFRYLSSYIILNRE